MTSIDVTGAAASRKAAAANALPVAAEKQTDQLAENIKPLFRLFLQNFSLSRGAASSSRATDADRVYIQRAKSLIDSNSTTLQIDYAHMSEYQAQLADAIREHYFRLMPAMDAVVQQFMKEHAPEHPEHRLANSLDMNTFRAAFYNLPVGSTIRDLKTKRIGELMSISGTITRTSAVRPELILGAFRCQDCQTINANIPQDFKYTEPNHCLNPACENRARWTLLPQLSHYGDFQLLRMQENSSEIPAGSMPRSIKIVLRHEAVELAKPGDKCTFTGTLIVVPDIAQLSGGSAGAKFVSGGNRGRTETGTGVMGLKELGVRDLTYTLCFLAASVRTSHSSYGSMAEVSLDAAGNPVTEAESFTPQEQDRIAEMKQQGRLYTRMVASIAPNVFGHDEIKRGILLMLFGGVHKKTSDGANLRGDINVCVVGDPASAKSQFLKYVCTFLPRAVYTSGKASSAAGLTASIARDPETGEFAIEAGALMLADNGICCIDEFDKMDPADQVAIHEAMEQQTISIAKAGIQATLNARTSILAAANPIKGRYDTSRTLKQNVDISAPIMSRFDLFFVVLDEGDQAIDYNIARHIVNVHTGKDKTFKPEFSLSDLQLYVRYARTLKPKISEGAKKDFVENYCQLRGADATGANKSAYRITVRQLESMIRLAEARARLDLNEEVTPSHVKEAARLLKKSIVHVENRDVSLIDEDLDEEFIPDGFRGGNNRPDDGDDDMNGGGGGAAEGKEDEGAARRIGVVGQRKSSAIVGTGSATQMLVDDGSPAPVAASGSAAVAPAGGEGRELKLSFSEYQRLTLLLVKYLRSHETTDKPSMSWSDLVNGYFSENLSGETPRSEAELVEQTRIVELVIHRLIKTDHILLLLKKSKDKSKRMLKVHPNFTGEADYSADSGARHAALDEIDEAAVMETNAALMKAGEAERQIRQTVQEEKSAPRTPRTPTNVATPTAGRASGTTPARTPQSGRSGRSKQ